MEKSHRDHDFSGEASYIVNTSDLEQNIKMESLISKYKKILTAIAAKWVFSCFYLIFTIIYVRNDQALDLSVRIPNTPLFGTWFSCTVTVLVCVVFRLAGQVSPNFVTIPKLKVEAKRIRATLPLSVMVVSIVILNSQCLKSFGTGFYSVGQPLTLAFSVIFTHVILHQNTSVKALICCAVIVATDLMRAEQKDSSDSLSVLTILLGVAASALWALKGIYVKKILPVVDNSVWLLTFYVNITAAVILTPLMLFFGDVKEVFNSSLLSSFRFWKFMITLGILASAGSFIVNLEIHVTSALTHTISQRAKACLLTILCNIYFQDVETGLWWLGSLLILFGGAAYAEVRREEMTQRHLESVMATQKLEQTAGELTPFTGDNVSMIKVSTLDPPRQSVLVRSSPLRLHSLGLR